MIVISGALVLVALVLLVLGLTMTDLSFVYGSIAVSLISFVFLVIGILQRRGEQPASADGPPVTEGEPRAAEAPARTAAIAVPATASGDGSGDGSDDDVDEAVPAGATVLVVPGRPRYHVEGCRYLAGKAVTEVDVGQAREQYTACGVCKPDAALAAFEEPALVDDEVVDSGVPGAEEPEPVAAPARARRASGTATATRPRKTTASSGRGSTRAVAAAPAAAADVEATPAPARAAAPVRRGRVVVIPDRPKFHLPACRFVRDALGTEELTRTQAGKQGYQPCGVCKP